jgi:hypothetical protein
MKASNPKATYKDALKSAGPLFKQSRGGAGKATSSGGAGQATSAAVKMGVISRKEDFVFSFSDNDPFDMSTWTKRDFRQ